MTTYFDTHDRAFDRADLTLRVRKIGAKRIQTAPIRMSAPPTYTDGASGMLTGTISDFDTEGLFGVIDADDGRLILFNLRDIRPQLREQFAVGTRVKFIERGGEWAPRAAALSWISANDGRS